MNKKVARGLATGLIMLTSVGVAFGAGTQFEIKAIMDSGVKIMYKGEAQNLIDVNGVTKDPIIYNGSVYVPIRSAGEIFGENVDWDEESRNVLLGDKVTDNNKPEIDGSDISMELNKEGIYAVNDNYFKSIVLDENSVLKAANYLNNIQEKYLTENNNVFYAVIPDKTFYENTSSYDKLDYDKMSSILNTNVKNMEYIELKDLLELDDYYRTDNHWKQESIIDIANRLGEKLGFKINANDFEKNTFTEFKGMYSKYITSSNKVEELQYLTNKHINSAIVDNYQNKEFTSVYDTARLNSKIPYDVYLSGASPFMTITNPNVKNDKELVIFRDSFASSLTPLMISEYSKITLIDTRFMASFLLKDFIEFNNQDVLFLYSSAVINNSSMLK